MKAPSLIVKRLIELSGIIGVIILVGMALLVAADVFLRFIFKEAIHGSMEYTVTLLVCVSYLGMGMCTLQGQHINVDVIAGRLAKKGRIFLNILNYVIVMAVCLLFITQGYKQALFLRSLDIRSSTVGIPQYPFVLVVVFGVLLMFLAVLIRLYNITKEPDPDRQRENNLDKLKG